MSWLVILPHGGDSGGVIWTGGGTPVGAPPAMPPDPPWPGGGPQGGLMLPSGQGGPVGPPPPVRPPDSIINPGEAQWWIDQFDQVGNSLVPGLDPANRPSNLWLGTQEDWLKMHGWRYRGGGWQSSHVPTRGGGRPNQYGGPEGWDRPPDVPPEPPPPPEPSEQWLQDYYANMWQDPDSLGGPRPHRPKPLKPGTGGWEQGIPEPTPEPTPQVTPQVTPNVSQGPAVGDYVPGLGEAAAAWQILGVMYWLDEWQHSPTWYPQYITPPALPGITHRPAIGPPIVDQLQDEFEQTIPGVLTDVIPGGILVKPFLAAGFLRPHFPRWGRSFSD